jgi:hypothetical protein
MAVAARITLRLVLIIDLANRIALAPQRSQHPALHKSDAGHEIVLRKSPVYADLMRFPATSARRFSRSSFDALQRAIPAGIALAQ